MDWRIIKYAWRTIYENGGHRIIVKHRDRIDDLDRSAYLEAFKSHNIPLKLEIRSGSPQKAIIAVDDQI